MKKLLIKMVSSFKIVLLLMLFVVVYYYTIAADRYVSEISLGVQSSNSGSSKADALASLIGAPPSSKEDVMHVKEYIHSLDMLNILNEKIKLREIYEKQTLDLFFRLYSSMNQESFHNYYKNRVELKYDEITGLLKVKVQGFESQDAQFIAQEILIEVDRFINELSHKISREQMGFAEDELLKAKERYQEAKSELITFQNKYGMFDPKVQAEAKAKLSIEIDSKIAQKETELATMLSYLNETAPQVVALKSEIVALKDQLVKESSKVASTESKSKLNELASKYQDLTIEAGFSEDAYKIALTAVEQNRIEANKKAKQLLVIQKPSLPESAVYPEKIYNILTIFLVLSLLYGIGRLIKEIIEEHKY